MEDICRMDAGSQHRYGSPRVHPSLQVKGKRAECNRTARLMRSHGTLGERKTNPTSRRGLELSRLALWLRGGGIGERGVIGGA